MLAFLNKHQGAIISLTMAALLAFGWSASFRLGQQSEVLASIQRDIARVEGLVLSASGDLELQFLAGLDDLKTLVESENNDIDARLLALRDATESLATALNDNVRAIDARLTLSEVDVRRLLVETGVVGYDDTFTVAIIDGNIWLFPSEELGISLRSAGFQFERVNEFFTGIRLGDWVEFQELMARQQ